MVASNIYLLWADIVGDLNIYLSWADIVPRVTSTLSTESHFYLRAVECASPRNNSVTNESLGKQSYVNNVKFLSY